MKKFSEQLKKRADQIRLRADERHELRERLLAYMEYHPLQTGGRSTRRLMSPRKTISISLNGWMVGKMLGASMVFFLVVIPTLAEKALPGEILYPVKVRFNEELRGALSSSPYAKIEWETERLERRLAEARLLADAGKLTPDAEAEVARAIKQHSDAAKQGIADMRQSDSEEAAIAEITLASALEVQSEVLGRQGEESGTVAVSALASAVNEAKLGVSPAEGETISYGKLKERLETETTRAYEYLGSLNGVTSVEEKSEVEKRLADVKVKVESAATLEGTDQPAASKLLAEALGSTRKIISFMTNLDVRKNVKIGDLVPATPNDAERRVALELKLQESELVMTAVLNGLDKVATTSTNHTELSEGVAHYRELTGAASSSLAAADVTAAENAANSALELAKALLDNLKIIGIEVEVATSTDSGPVNR